MEPMPAGNGEHSYDLENDVLSPIKEMIFARPSENDEAAVERLNMESVSRALADDTERNKLFEVLSLGTPSCLRVTYQAFSMP